MEPAEVASPHLSNPIQSWHHTRRGHGACWPEGYLGGPSSPTIQEPGCLKGAQQADLADGTVFLSGQEGKLRLPVGRGGGGVRGPDRRRLRGDRGQQQRQQQGLWHRPAARQPLPGPLLPEVGALSGSRDTGVGGDLLQEVSVNAHLSVHPLSSAPSCALLAPRTPAGSGPFRAPGEEVLVSLAGGVEGRGQQ